MEYGILSLLLVLALLHVFGPVSSTLDPILREKWSTAFRWMLIFETLRVIDPLYFLATIAFLCFIKVTDKEFDHRRWILHSRIVMWRGLIWGRLLLGI